VTLTREAADVLVGAAPVGGFIGAFIDEELGTGSS
jgi:hypothetical protein